MTSIKSRREADGGVQAGGPNGAVRRNSIFNDRPGSMRQEALREEFAAAYADDDDDMPPPKSSPAKATTPLSKSPSKLTTRMNAEIDTVMYTRLKIRALRQATTIGRVIEEWVEANCPE